MAVELLRVLGLEHKLALDEIFDGTLDKSIVALSHSVKVLAILVHSANQLLMRCRWKERLLVRDVVCSSLLN